MSISRLFNLGKSVEDTLDKMAEEAKQPQPPKPDPEAEKMKAEMELKQQDAKDKTDLAQIDKKSKIDQANATIATIQAKGRNDAQKHQQDMEKGALELEKLRRELAAPQETAAPAKGPSESIAFKDLPPEGQVQMAAQAGINLSPEQMAQHAAAQQDAQLKVKTAGPPKPNGAKP